MDNVRQLFKSIVAGKDYQELFNSIMSDKILERIAQEKERVAKSMLETRETDPKTGQELPRQEVVVVDPTTGNPRKVVRRTSQREVAN
jgi:hypothetical protein